MEHNVITLIPYVDKIYCKTVLGEVYVHQQTCSAYGRNREININHNRHELQQEIRKAGVNADLVLLMDSDVIAEKEQLEALLENFEGKPLALRTKDFDTGRHVCCACCLMRLEDYLAIDYVGEYVDVCQCSKIMEKFGVSYLEGYQAHEWRDVDRGTNIFHGESVPFYTEKASVKEG